MERIYYLTMLYDFYQDMLTEKQRVFFARYHFDDMSLTEMGTEFGMTPQGARDMVHRACKAMEQWEGKLHLLRRHREAQSRVGTIIETIQGINGIGDDIKAGLVQQIQSLIE